jgi:carbon starvation protein CstA
MFYIAARVIGLRSLFVEIMLAFFALVGAVLLLVIVYFKIFKPLFLHMKNNEDLTKIYKSQKKETTFRRI